MRGDNNVADLVHIPSATILHQQRFTARTTWPLPVWFAGFSLEELFEGEAMLDQPPAWSSRWYCFSKPPQLLTSAAWDSAQLGLDHPILQLAQFGQGG